MALEKELETYKQELPNLLSHAGKYALVHKDQVVSIWGTYEDALQEGYKLFSLDPFLVKQIQAVELVHRVTRDVPLTCQS